jgi:HK97 family phage prohead protease
VTRRMLRAEKGFTIRVAKPEWIKRTELPDGSGGFEGFALRFDVEDSYGTTWAPEVFDKGGIDAQRYALLWMHSPWDPVGAFTAEVRKNEGLWIAGEYDPTPEGQTARGRALNGSASELSIGAYLRDFDPDDPARITEAALVETSQVTARFASVPGAALAAVRARLAYDSLESTQGPNPDRAERMKREARRARARLQLLAALG